jgi:predicted metal-binding membrane protein
MGDDSSVRSKRNDNHRKNKTSRRRSSRRSLAGFRAIARLTVATEQSIQIRRQKLILFVAGLGIIFLASVVQTFGTNWLGQACPYPGPCFHWEWLAIGVVLSAAAYFAWKTVNNSRH